MDPVASSIDRSFANTQAGDVYVAVRVRARAELSIARTLLARGVETLCPVHLSRRFWCDRVKITPEALFPCYLFTRFQPGLRRTILTAPGVQDIVNNGCAPIPLDEHEIDLVKRLASDAQNSRPCPRPEAGQRVRIHHGPLNGVEGQMIRTKTECRIILSIPLLQRSVMIEIPDEYVTILS